MLLLETELPDELMQGGSSWEQQMVTNKPPAQGPGPGQQQQQQQMYNSQMNGGEESIVPANVASLQQQQQQQRQQQHQQQLAHLLQQGQKNPMVNPHLNQLAKNPNLNQGGNPNATVMNNLVNMPMSMAPNNNGTNANMPMQGKFLLILTFLNLNSFNFN